MLLSELAATSQAVAATPARLGKVGSLAGCLGRLQPAEVGVAVAFLSGELRQRQIGVGYASLRDLSTPAMDHPPLIRVDAADGDGVDAYRRHRTGLLDLLA